MNLFSFGPNNLDNNVSKIIIGILNIIVYRIPIFNGPFVINNLLSISKYIIVLLTFQLLSYRIIYYE